MYSSEDFERLFIQYKAEAYRKGESIQSFCHRKNVPYNLFQKWYKDTRHRVVEVEVEGKPASQERKEECGPAQPSKTSTQRTEKPGVRIVVDLKTSNGLHLRQTNLSYEGLKRLVEKLEGLC